jgi:hypothetical protein
VIVTSDWQGEEISLAAAFGLMGLGAITTIFTDPTSSGGSYAFAQASTYYENTDDGFRVQIPNGWVIEDIDNADPTALEEE